MTRTYCFTLIALRLAGRVAEELIFDEVTNGAADDLERATELARKMVCEWGMSDKMGPIVYGKKEEQIFLGREIDRHQDYSEATAIEIDEEVRRVMIETLELVRKLLNEHLHFLHAIAAALLEKEVLDGAEIDAIMNAAAPA